MKYIRYSQYIDQCDISGMGRRRRGGHGGNSKGGGGRGGGEKWTVRSTLPAGLGVALAGDCRPLSCRPTRRRPRARRASTWPRSWDPPDCPAASTSPPAVCPGTQRRLGFSVPTPGNVHGFKHVIKLQSIAADLDTQHFIFLDTLTCWKVTLVTALCIYLSFLCIFSISI